MDSAELSEQFFQGTVLKAWHHHVCNCSESWPELGCPSLSLQRPLKTNELDCVFSSFIKVSIERSTERFSWFCSEFSCSPMERFLPDQDMWSWLSGPSQVCLTEPDPVRCSVGEHAVRLQVQSWLLLVETFLRARQRVLQEQTWRNGLLGKTSSFCVRFMFTWVKLNRVRVWKKAVVYCLKRLLGLVKLRWINILPVGLLK